MCEILNHKLSLNYLEMEKKETCGKSHSFNCPCKKCKGYQQWVKEGIGNSMDLKDVLKVEELQGVYAHLGGEAKKIYNTPGFHTIEEYNVPLDPSKPISIDNYDRKLIYGKYFTKLVVFRPADGEFKNQQYKLAKKFANVFNTLVDNDMLGPSNEPKVLMKASTLPLTTTDINYRYCLLSYMYSDYTELELNSFLGGEFFSQEGGFSEDENWGPFEI